MVNARQVFGVASLVAGVKALSTVVSLDNGLVLQGRRSPYANSSHVVEFLGIPYASPPIDSLRFSPPVLYSPNKTEHVNVTALPPSCYQYISSAPSLVQHDIYGWMIGSAGMSEDCLKLSMWVPANVSATANLPVVIWFYGGGFATGGTDVPYQQPAQWIERSQSHIFVTFNYRMGIFGFPNSPALEEQNLGLMDMRLAVEWTKANIAKFGGNPDQMILWGHSAGSEAVDMYNFAYPEDPIVKGLIMDSGTTHLDLLISSDTIQSNFSYVAQNVGCANTTTKAAELACMRSLPATTLEDFYATYQDSGASPAINFVPVRDEKIVFDHYTERAAIGAMANLPAIIGNTANEAIFLAPYSATGAPASVVDPLSYTYFWCPSTKTTYERLAANRTTYRYMWYGNFSNISPVSWAGAYHGSNLPMFFGTHGNLRGNSTEFEYEVSAAMQDSYLAFARDPGNGLAGVGWPKYEMESGRLVRTFAENGMAVGVTQLDEIERECAALGEA